MVVLTGAGIGVGVTVGVAVGVEIATLDCNSEEGTSVAEAALSLPGNCQGSRSRRATTTRTATAMMTTPRSGALLPLRLRDRLRYPIEPLSIHAHLRPDCNVKIHNILEKGLCSYLYIEHGLRPEVPSISLSRPHNIIPEAFPCHNPYLSRLELLWIHLNHAV